MQLHHAEPSYDGQVCPYSNPYPVAIQTCPYHFKCAVLPFPRRTWGAIHAWTVDIKCSFLTFSRMPRSTRAFLIFVFCVVWVHCYSDWVHKPRGSIVGDRQQQKQKHLQVLHFVVRVQLVIANYILQRNPYQKLLLVRLYFVLSENVVAFSIIMVKERTW